MTLLKKFIELIILSMFVVGCQGGGIKWDATIFVGDYVEGGIRGPENQFIYATDPKFNSYACVSEEDFNELIDILSRARLPGGVKRKIFNTADLVNSQLKPVK